MASGLFLLRRSLLPSFRLSPAAAAACCTTLVAAPLLVHQLQRPVLMDSFSMQQSPALRTYQREAKTPIVKDGRLNERALRQVSAGSILGLAGGVLVSFFSKPLALLIGLLIVGVQALESRGIHIVPYQRIQGYVKGINLRGALQDNVAFKLSFGVTFALAAFAQF
ncbi:uncharacterized protein PV09_00066 [Verruconis gallopava]|uniref:Fun14 family protein n=1 Tax=Verruconis gallopava TaxID=253628 RepID=A0A0D2BCL6_9PEZI|nr:uncharacterized protein PV09_00066 [Verruconis gallopava]KIW09124.1 hypothetical protein PV09_00066 [Verruconis gallopava]